MTSSSPFDPCPSHGCNSSHMMLSPNSRCANVARGHVPEPVLLRADYCVARLNNESDPLRGPQPIQFLPGVANLRGLGGTKKQAHDRLCRAVRNVKFLSRATLSARRNPFIRDGCGSFFMSEL